MGGCGKKDKNRVMSYLLKLHTLHTPKCTKEMSNVNAQEVKLEEKSREISEESKHTVQLPPKPRPSSLSEDSRENTLKATLFPSFLLPSNTSN